MVLDLNRPAQKPQGMLCPHCQVPLVMSSRQNIEIDYCPTCRGVWLDRGELDKIIERSVAEIAAAKPRPAPSRTEPASRRDDDDDKYSKKKYRKKSWLAEIFDELT